MAFGIFKKTICASPRLQNSNTFFSFSSQMSENQSDTQAVHSYPCGPSTMTIDSLDWSKASLVYICGREENRYTTSKSSGSEAVKPGRWSLLLTLAIFLFNIVCA